jgi:hypothetical protein
MYTIKFVEHEAIFYQLGSLQTWELTCELFEYAGETINTGIPQVDVLQKKFDTNQYNWTIKDIDGSILLDEEGSLLVLEGAGLDDLISNADNDEIQRESDLFVDFTAYDPFSEKSI